MIFVSSSSIQNNSDIMHVLKRYTKLGIRNIELGAVHSIIRDLRPIVEYRKKSNANFIIHVLFPPAQQQFILNIGSQNPRWLKRTLDTAKRCIDFAEKVDARLYTLHPGMLCDLQTFHSEPVRMYEYRGTWRTFIDSINHLVEYANAKRIDVAVETMVNPNMFVCTTMEELAMLFRQTKAGLLVDLGHLNRKMRRDEQLDLIRRFGRRIREFHVHENDGTSDQHRPLRNAGILEEVPRDILARANLTLEGMGTWTQAQIKDSIRILSSVSSS